MKLLMIIKTLGLCSIFFISSTLCMPNIRIQVNNENMQNPPYLLEAIRQAESSEQQQAASIGHQTLSEPSSKQTVQPIALEVAASPRANFTDEISTDQEAERANSESYGVAKEETIEEISELEPDSTSKLSTENVSSSQLSHELPSRVPIMVVATTESSTTLTEIRPSKKASSLPVTSSHLKRPAGATGQLDDEPSAGLGSMLSETRSQMEDEDAGLSGSSLLASGSESLAAPSVAADEGSVSVNLDKSGQQAPDTLEPSQVMQGNVSLTPATITKQYGANTRTRITLGGGYVRDKLPPLANTGSSDNANENPVTSLERLEKPQSFNSGVEKNPDQENSRIIEVPERIMLPENVFAQPRPQQQQAFIRGDNKFLLLNVTTTNEEQRKPMGKLDSRCSKKATHTFEHPTACDKYFLCQDGYLSEHTCPNGLMYGTSNLVKDYCVHRWEATCDDKSVPNPISSPGCRWQWGMFSVQGSPRCTPDFYECRDGQFEVRKCPLDGQIYDDRTKSCRYAELVGCNEEALADFKCPPDDQGNTYWPFPRYFLNERALIHCVNDKPAIVRCRDHERVDPEHLHCVPFKTSSVDGDSTSVQSRSLRDKKDKKEKQSSS